MDYMRSGYTTEMQFDNDGLVKAKVTWYACEDGALDFPTPHLFCSIRTWNWHGLLLAGPGENLNAGVSWNSSAPPGFFPGTGDYCGPLDWFQNGVPSDAPPLTIGPGGTPTCCPQVLCQPMFGSDASTINVRSVNPVVPWEVFPFSPGLIFLDTALSDPTGQIQDFGPICQLGVVSTLCQVAFSAYPLVNTMQIIAFDPVSFTGTYQFVNPSMGPPGFLLFVTMTPP